MAEAYRNKYAARCEATGTWVEQGAGWVVPTRDGKWRVLSDSAARSEGHKLHEDGKQQTSSRGVTRGLGASQTWAKVFQENEERAASGQKPWTDDEISRWMQQEFPNSPAESKSPQRVRMYRSNYNRGAHSFADMGKPKVQSREYDAKGEAVERKSSGGFGVSEERVRQIAREEDKSLVQELREEMKSRPLIDIQFAPGRKSKKRVDSAGKHEKFVDILKLVEAGVPILLVGPAGCGKTKLAGQVAEALDLPFTFNSMSEGVSESHLLGRVVPDAKGVWQYKESPFVKSYRDGGVHLLDEIDAADPNLLVSVNAAIANRQLALPFASVEPVQRHDSSILIAAANTFGHGADRQYVGRNQLDASTLDRFKMGTVAMDYDRNVESAIAEALAGGAAGGLLDWAWMVRGAIRANRMRRVMSTRNIEDASKLLAVGLDLSYVKRAYLEDWTVDERAKVK